MRLQAELMCYLVPLAAGGVFQNRLSAFTLPGLALADLQTSTQRILGLLPASKQELAELNAKEEANRAEINLLRGQLGRTVSPWFLMMLSWDRKLLAQVAQ